MSMDINKLAPLYFSQPAVVQLVSQLAALEVLQGYRFQLRQCAGNNSDIALALPIV